MSSIEAAPTMAEPGRGGIFPQFNEDACDSLQVTFEEHGGSEWCRFVKIRGRIDSSNVRFFQSRMMKAIDPGGYDLVLVFYSAQEISRETAGVLRQIRKAAKDKGVHLWSMSSRRTGGT